MPVKRKVLALTALRFHGGQYALLLGSLIPALVSAQDVSGAPSEVPYDATPLISVRGSDIANCPAGPVPTPLSLMEAVERTLCSNPKTHAAWANVKAATARIGAARVAWLPTLEGSSQYVREHFTTDVRDSPELKSSYSGGVNEERLSLSWLLYDFGSRSAALESNRELLAAAEASQSATLQTVFAATAKDYFDVQSADAKVQSARRIESAARQIVDAAGARVAHGVAPITDQLQANTAYEESVYERAKAIGQSRTAVGALAVDMDLMPDQELTLPKSDPATLPDPGFSQAIHDLVEDAVRTHPGVVAAEAQWRAAVAKVQSARAQGLPTLSIVGQMSYGDQPVSASLGQPELPAITRDNFIGMKITVPLFEGWNRHYRIREAEAEAQVQEDNLRDTRRRVASDVWASYQTLQSDSENLRNAEALLRSAQESCEAVRHRYESGVGNILEMLSSENALSRAEQQRIQAQADWRAARIQLALSLGKLGMWAAQ